MFLKCPPPLPTVGAHGLIFAQFCVTITLMKIVHLSTSNAELHPEIHLTSGMHHASVFLSAQNFGPAYEICFQILFQNKYIFNT